MAATQTQVAVNTDDRPLPPGWSAYFEPTQQKWVYIQLSAIPPRVVFEHPADLDLPPGIDDMPTTSPQPAVHSRPLPTPGQQPAPAVSMPQPAPRQQSPAPIFAPTATQVWPLPTPPNSAASQPPPAPVSMPSPAPAHPSRPVSTVGQPMPTPVRPVSTIGQVSPASSRPMSVSASPVSRPPPSTLTAAQRLYQSAGVATPGPLVNLNNIKSLSTSPAADRRSSRELGSSMPPATPPKAPMHVNHPPGHQQHFSRAQSVQAVPHTHTAAQQHPHGLHGRTQTYSGPGTQPQSLGSNMNLNAQPIIRPTGGQQQGQTPVLMTAAQNSGGAGAPRPTPNVVMVTRPPDAVSQLQSPPYTPAPDPQFTPAQPDSPPPPLSPLSFNGSSTGSPSPPQSSLLLSSPGSISPATTMSSMGSPSPGNSPAIAPVKPQYATVAAAPPHTFSSMYHQPPQQNTMKQSAASALSKTGNGGRLAAQLIAKTTGSVLSSVVAATTGVRVDRMVNALTSPAMVSKLWAAIPSSKTGTGVAQADLQAVLEGRPHANYNGVLAALQKQQRVHEQQVIQHQQLVARLQAQLQAGQPVQNYQIPPAPAPPPVDYATLIAEVRRLQAAAQHQVVVQQQVTAQHQALAQQQALAQKIAYAQMGQAATAQGFVQPLQQHNQMHPQQTHQQHHLQAHQQQAHQQQAHQHQAHPQQQQGQHHPLTPGQQHHPQNHTHQQPHAQQHVQQHPQQHAHQHSGQQHPQQHVQQNQHFGQPHVQQQGQQGQQHVPHSQQHPQHAHSQSLPQQQWQPNNAQQAPQTPPQTKPSPQPQQQWQPNTTQQTPPQQWQPNTAQQTTQVNPQLQPQQPWQPNAEQSPPQHYQPNFTTPASQPPQAHQQHQPAHHNSLGHNLQVLHHLVDSLTDQNNQQSQNQTPSYVDNSNNFAVNPDQSNNWFDPNAQPQTPPPQSPDFSSFSDGGNGSTDPTSQFYNMITQAFDPNANTFNGDNSGNFSSNATDIFNNITQGLQPQQSPDFSSNIFNSLTQSLQPNASGGDPNSNLLSNMLSQAFQPDPTTSFGGDNGGLASTLLNSFVNNANTGSTDTSSNGGAFDLSGLASGLVAGMVTDNFNLDVDVNVNYTNTNC